VVDLAEAELAGVGKNNIKLFVINDNFLHLIESNINNNKTNLEDKYEKTN